MPVAIVVSVARRWAHLRRPELVNGVKGRGKAARGTRVRRSRGGPASGGLEHNSRYLTESLEVLHPGSSDACFILSPNGIRDELFFASSLSVC